MDKFLEMLDLENSLPSVTAAQLEANAFRRDFYLRLNQQRPEPSPTVFTDICTEKLIARLKNEEYRFSPRSLLE